MINNKNIPYYLMAIGIFILFKLVFVHANNDNLTFLLSPIDKLIGLITGSNSVYNSDNGYFHNQLNILIDKSCAGFNFWVLSFLMLTFLGLKYSISRHKRILAIPFALTGAYFLTIFVNTSRIFASIIVQNQANNFLPTRPHYLIHEATGIIINLTFLILTYILTERILTNRIHNEKLT